MKDLREVFDLIEGEIDYQREQKWQSDEIDASTSVAAWIIFAECKIKEAKERVYNLNPDQAMESLRKVAAICATAMQHNETASR